MKKIFKLFLNRLCFVIVLIFIVSLKIKYPYYNLLFNILIVIIIIVMLFQKGDWFMELLKKFK